MLRSTTECTASRCGHFQKSSALGGKAFSNFGGQIQSSLVIYTYSVHLRRVSPMVAPHTLAAAKGRLDGMVEMVLAAAATAAVVVMTGMAAGASGA